MLVEGRQLVVRAATNQRIVCIANPLEADSISGQVARSGQAVYITDVAQSAFAQVRCEGDRSNYRIKSLISLPLVAEGQPMGVLNLSDKAGAPAFGQNDLALAQTIAFQLSCLINFNALHSRLCLARALKLEAQGEVDKAVEEFMAAAANCLRLRWPFFGLGGCCSARGAGRRPSAATAGFWNWTPRPWASWWSWGASARPKALWRRAAGYTSRPWSCRWPSRGSCLSARPTGIASW